MSDTVTETAAETASDGRQGRRRRGGGADARRARRQAGQATQLTYITRKLEPFGVLDEDGLALIEANADTVLKKSALNSARMKKRWRCGRTPAPISAASGCISPRAFAGR